MKTFEHSEMIQGLPKQFFAKLVNKVAAAKTKHDDIINLGQGNPDQPTAPHIIKALQEAAENPLYSKYSPFRGYSFLKEAVATYYKREYGVEVDPEKEVAVLMGAKAGLVEVSQCLLNQGDVALVPDPGYPDYWSGIALAGANMSFMPLKAEHDFLPDFSQLHKNDLQKSKLMFLNYPNNPTGATATEALFQDAIEIGNKHDICIVHDFAYGAIGFDGKKPLSMLEVPGAKDVGVEMITMSKTYNMAGWRVGFAVGNPSVIEAINLIQDHLHCSLYGGIQEAAAKALLGPQDCVDELVQRYESRRNTFISALQNIGWNVKAPQGSFFAWLPVPEGYTSETFADLLLEKAQVAVAPGIGFGDHGEGYVRVGLLSDEDVLLEAAKRIEKLDLFSTD
ncbi:pyridoxal phosphate-dependent aminotransferase [Desertibacillus haloalkaliphilus]|uniref:pyridoxal phosphate-dependent aminotransferase n=1 Tax=Desertibacillus haloalkaliphilus TaxID=1328930 RepID=UPI001C26E304|nr:pyridoxal phosphate-dependent aminotransferase [Desertibacillus haloalkaliphilus]MBU8906475.1 pyridoxal phosphate-dependent aminotransferase [Desertibacillus haloalkaliphilus]